jgi:integrase
MRAGVSREIVLGGKDMTLADARAAAAATKAEVRGGGTPGQSSGGVTLRAAVQDWIAASAPGWRGKNERLHAENQLKHWFGGLYDRDVTTLTKPEVLAVLKVAWQSPSVGERLLSRISRVGERLTALDAIPANWADSRTMRALLPKLKPSGEHHAAVPVDEAAGVYRKIRSRTSLAALCLALIAQTAVRSGAARGAEWSEFQLDGDKPVWIVSEERTKTGKALTVPLSPQVVALVRTVPRAHPKLLFAGRTGRPLTDMAILKEMRLWSDEWTVHGWRSSARDFMSLRRFDSDLAELCLGHHVGGAVFRAYQRDDLVELRRPLMCAWSDLLSA